MRKRNLVTVIAAVLLVSGCAVAVLLLAPHRTKPLVPAANNSSNPTKSVTAGGKLVPPDLQAKAKAKGYYCPSWDAKPGQVVSDICVPLDK